MTYQVESSSETPLPEAVAEPQPKRRFWAVTVVFNENNSGGGWWLSAEDYRTLEAAGWVCEHPRVDDRYYGRNATTTEFVWAETEQQADDLGYAQAKKDWETLLDKDASEQGCNCCGPPYQFRVDETNQVEIEIFQGWNNLQEQTDGDAH